ncbi:Pol polyprotein [Schistosoma japonicum]|uniref:Pol polyprotein n=1 Tax=Schistosoma japonicum TaxID=6182 RepID=A0A4Z2DRM0_SCHJA|nr:Pol polyprotein [Schistosoma japonicum]
MFTDHKQLTFFMKPPSDKYSPRESRYLDYTSQFSTDMQHISGVKNVVADALLRIHSLNRIQGIDLVELARLQNEDNDLHHELSTTTLKLQTKTIGKGTARPIVLRSYL